MRVNGRYQHSGRRHRHAIHRGVAIFTPSDGITLSQHTPLNKWAKLVPDITSELKKQGFKSANITTTTSSDLAKQSQDIQDYVVNHAVAAQSGKDSANKKDGADEKAITLIVAPAAETQTSTRQYGDYVSQTSGTATDRTGSDEAGSTDASESTDTPESANASSSDNASDSTDTESMPRMANALQLAKDSGMHVVLVANPVKDFTPDAFVELSTAERIGQIQASKLADKLQLDTISKDNPKAVEILLPYTASADGSDDEFAKEAFAGAWSVLQPYFKKGTAYSPSGLLTADTTDGQWESVAFKIDKDSRITDEITNRLKQKNSASHTRIDGIIAMNDYVASGVVDALDHLGYTGSAADINPSITLPGIVGNITGKQDLHRKKVPDPIKAPENDGDATNDGSASEKARDTQWPIITGYGAYVDELPQLVSGHQWMTAVEDRKGAATQLAQMCLKINQGTAVKSPQNLTKGTYPGVAGKNMPTLRPDLVAISASNLKSTLIDPGYITLADAGM